jgi:hypothetical protein
MDGHDVGRRTAQHLLGFLAGLEHLPGVFIHGHHRGFTQHHALFLGEYAGAVGTHIHGHVSFKNKHLVHLM